MQRSLPLVILRIHIRTTRDQIADTINTAAAIAARLKNNRRPPILCAIRITIHPAARKQGNNIGIGDYSQR